MLDFHTHVLPEIDDGASNIDVAADILRLEREQGVQTIVCTPHYYGKSDVEAFLQARAAALEQIELLLSADTELLLGAEVLYTGINAPSYDALCRLSIANTRCVLLEFPFTTEWQCDLVDRTAKLISDTCCVPIIAHVERYTQFLKNPKLLTELSRAGCYLQWNTGAFLRKSTRKFAFAALKHGLVHCLGTDAHNATHRAPNYAAAKEEIFAAGGGEWFERAQACMQALLQGEMPKTYDREMRKLFGFYL